MDVYAEHFKERTGMSETARVDRAVLLCYAICAFALTCFGRISYHLPIDDFIMTIRSLVYYILLWTPIIICKFLFYRLIEKPLRIRRILYTFFFLFYAYVLCTDENYACVLMAIPFLIMTISYGSLVLTLRVSISASIMSLVYALIPIAHHMGQFEVKLRFYPYITVFASTVLLNVMAYILECIQRERRLQIENERNRLKSLVSLGIGQVFEYDANKDILVISKGESENASNEHVIENFTLAAKQYRYVLFADWDKFDDIVKNIPKEGEKFEYQLRLRDRNADYKWYKIKGQSNEKEPGMLIGYIENIDEIKRLELRQADESKRDPLTKLYRLSYAKELSDISLKKQADTANTKYAALLTLDVDDFEAFNSKMGKAFGDEVIKNIASELDMIFYPTDVLGRAWRDGFVILMENIKSIDDVDKKIKEIQAVIGNIYVGENTGDGISVGIGAAIYPLDGSDFDSLYGKARKAMYHAKSGGKRRYGFYNPMLEDVYEQYVREDDFILRASQQLSNMEDEGVSDSLIELAFKLMDESKDTDSAINLLIRQVSKQLNLGGICIKSRVARELRTKVLYQCSAHSDIGIDNTDLTYSLSQWIEMLEDYKKNNNIIQYGNVAEIGNQLDRQLLLSMGARSYVGCAFFDKGEFIGNIDFIDFSKTREWSKEEITVMRAVTNVISSYLLKMKAYEDASDTVERLTGYDGVTGLLMYEKFLSLSGEYIESAPHGKYAMVYMDFSNFKYVNETYGYETGDKILRNLAEEAEHYVGSYIYGSRVFSDNIVVFCQIGDISDEELLRVFEKISKNFSDRMQMEYIDSKLLLDVGICTFEICGKPIPLKNIISNANLARKRTKLPDSPRCIIYDDEMGNELKNEMAYASDMENAFHNHEFVVYLQPKVNLQTNSIDGAEALIRWKKKDGRLIFPNDFIPVFEKNKSITLLDYYVYDEVCKYIRGRIDSGKKVVRISINVSRVHLYSSEELISYVRSLLQKYRIPPELLEFELTETVFSEKMEDTVHLMSKLRELGVLISMDDFGSGYSSLNALTKLPLDVLKLDKEFLDDFENDPEEKIIIPSVIDMAKKLKLTVVCEGVETKEQVAFLRDVGCDYAQGYFYSKPIPQDQFDQLLEV